MDKRGGRRKGFDQPQEIVGFLGRPFGPVYAGEVRGQVHRHPVAQIHQFGPARLDIPGHGTAQRARKDLLLTPMEVVLAKNAELHDPPLAMLLAMQGQQGAVHDDRALIIERLLQVGMSQTLRNLVGIPDNARCGHGEQSPLALRSGRESVISKWMLFMTILLETGETGTAGTPGCSATQEFGEGLQCVKFAGRLVRNAARRRAIGREQPARGDCRTRAS